MALAYPNRYCIRMSKVGAEDYYRQVSPGPRLKSIDRPALIFAAADDPFVLEARMRNGRAESVSMEIFEVAGHVGFVGCSKALGHFWAADRILGFLDNVLVSSKGRQMRS